MYNTLLELFFPDHCVICGSSQTNSSLLCASCERTAERVRDPFCQTCSRPFEGSIPHPISCPNCVSNAFAFACAVAPYRARGIVRDLVHRFKYSGHYHLRHVLARWACEGLADRRLQETLFDAIVPVPLHAARQRERGFNQAVAIAELVGREAHLPVLRCLSRTRYTETQTHLDRGDRLSNLSAAFALRAGYSVFAKKLLIVDDVLTTGSTLDECARVLVSAGADLVKALTVARG
jgi:competence protein ComFC